MPSWRALLGLQPRVRGVAALRARLERFRHLLAGNSRVLELIGDAETKLGGDYLFDTQYLRTLGEELERALRGVAGDLAEISGNRYPELDHALGRVLRAVHGSLEPDQALQSLALTVPLQEIGTVLAGGVGEKMARLGEIQALDLTVPAGFVVTVRACALLLSAEPLAEAVAALRADPARAAGGELERLVQQTEVPREVARAIRRALSPYGRRARFAVRSSALGEDGARSFAGQHRTELNVPRHAVVDGWRRVVASLFSPSALAYRRQHSIAPPEAAMAVGCLLMVPAVASGVAYSVDPTDPSSDALVVAAVRGLGTSIVEGRSPPDRFCVARDPPHGVVARALGGQQEVCVPAPEGGVRFEPVPERELDQPSVGDATLSVLGAQVVRIERYMRRPQDVEWAVGPDGQLVILQARPLEVHAEVPRNVEALGAARLRHRVLLAGVGQVACRGVGAGPVFVVDDRESTADFAPGDVLVARHASPGLASAVAVASAVVTDVGAATGHLATVAREHRVPTIVNAREATRVLRPGALVTVDANDSVVYEGRVEELLRYQLLRGQAFEEAREFRMLRRMLRHVAPLYLRDPAAPGFAARACRTAHDIIRFAHEKALGEFAQLNGFRPAAGGEGVHELELDVPLDLMVVDLGGGVAPGSEQRGTLKAQEIASRPLRSLLEGLCAPGVWATDPADMDLEGLMASATRAGPLTMFSGGTVRRNVAIISSDYLNLNLRVGYHFNVVDCYLAENSDDNYILFRFVGGVTELARRTRRARLLGKILGQYGFHVELHGDLVVGRLKAIPPELVEERLHMVGRLVGFARQLDIVLREDEVVERLAEHFLEECYDAQPRDGRGERAMADMIDVMVLDDEPTVGERLKEFLEHKGMRVEAFVDSRAAVARLDAKTFDVVVTDLKMREPTGIDVLVAVKERNLPTEVIIITGYRTIEASRGAEHIGAFGFVDKPFRMDEVSDLVRKAAKRARKHAGADRA